MLLIVDVVGYGFFMKLSIYIFCAVTKQITVAIKNN